MGSLQLQGNNQILYWRCKTVAAMWAMKQMFDLGKGVLVLLPSKLLLEQWSKELRDFFPDISLLLVGGGNLRGKIPDYLRRP